MLKVEKKNFWDDYVSFVYEYDSESKLWVWWCIVIEYRQKLQDYLLWGHIDLHTHVNYAPCIHIKGVGSSG